MLHVRLHHPLHPTRTGASGPDGVTHRGALNVTDAQWVRAEAGYNNIAWKMLELSVCVFVFDTKHIPGSHCDCIYSL